MRKFYKVVTTSRHDSGYQILLDGKPVKTKAGEFLLAPTEKIANIIQKEWAQQEDEVVPDSMPFTQILNTKIDRVGKEREAMTASLLKYLNTDLICYPAADPKPLYEMQEKHWQPIRAWFDKNFNATLLTTTGLAALSQDDALHAKVHDYVSELDDNQFTVLQLVTSVSGSLILGLAFMYKEIGAQEVLDACTVEERFKDQFYDPEKYGADPMQEKAWKAAFSDLDAAQQYLCAL